MACKVLYEIRLDESTIDKTTGEVTHRAHFLFHDGETGFAGRDEVQVKCASIHGKLKSAAKLAIEMALINRHSALSTKKFTFVPLAEASGV